MDRINRVGRGHCYVDYANPDHAELAMKNMDGGQIDGQEISAAPILMPKARPQQPMRRSPMRGGRGQMNRWRGGGGGGGGGRGGSPNRFNRRSPRRNSPRRRNRSRSPIRRRQRRSSSGSSR